MKTKCLTPLQNLTKQATTLESLAHIGQAAVEAVRLKDEALDQVERYLALKSEEGKTVPDNPVVKARRVVSPRKYVKTSYLESQTDVNDFLDDLRKELTDALEMNQRIEIR